MRVYFYKHKSMRMYLIPTISILPDRLYGGFLEFSFWKWHLTFEWF